MKEKIIVFELPKKLVSNYKGEQFEVRNLGDWKKTKLLQNGKEVNVAIQRILIDVGVDRITNLTIHYVDIP